MAHGMSPGIRRSLDLGAASCRRGDNGRVGLRWLSRRAMPNTVTDAATFPRIRMPTRSEPPVFGSCICPLLNMVRPLPEKRRFGRVDITLKKLLSGGAPGFQSLIGLPRLIDFLPGEVYEETELRVDVLARGQREESPYYHVELQSKNHSKMLIRMLRYQAGIAHRLIEEGRHSLVTAPLPSIHQKCLYVGINNISMQDEFEFGGNTYRYERIDASKLPITTQLESRTINDVVLSLICLDGSSLENIDRILSRISRLDLPHRSEAFARLVALAPLRSATTQVFTRMSAMGFSVDLGKVPFLEAAFRQHWQAGARAKEVELVREAIADRFGGDALTQVVLEEIDRMDTREILETITRLATAPDVQHALPEEKPANTPVGG
jgi:hypothetical protein